MKRFAHCYPLETSEKIKIEKKYLDLKIDIKKKKEEFKDLTYDEVWKKLKVLLEKKHCESVDGLHMLQSQDSNFVDYFVDPFDKFSWMSQLQTAETVEHFCTRLLYCVVPKQNYFEDIKYYFNYSVQFQALYDKKIRWDSFPKGLGKALIGEKYNFPVNFDIHRKNDMIEGPAFCQYYQKALLESPTVGAGIFKEPEKRKDDGIAENINNQKEESKDLKKYYYTRIKKALLEQICLSNVPLTYSDIWLIENTMGFNLVMTLFLAIVDEKDFDLFHQVSPVIEKIIRLKGIRMRIEIATRFVDFLNLKFSNKNYMYYSLLEEDLGKIIAFLDDLIQKQNETYDLLAEGMLYLVNSPETEGNLFGCENKPEIILISNTKNKEIENKISNVDQKSADGGGGSIINVRGEAISFEHQEDTDDKSAQKIKDPVQKRKNSATPINQYGNLQEFVLCELYKINKIIF